MAATPVYSFPYPGTGDSPHGPNQVKALADAVEAKFITVDAAVAALQNPADTAFNIEQVATGSTSSASYTATLTGGVACGLSFTAPPSGKVMIFNNGLEAASATAQLAYCTIRVRTGSTIGSGSDVLAAADDWAIVTKEDFFEGKGRSKMVPALTPGALYNVQQLFRSSSGTAQFSGKELIVQYIP